MNIIHKIAAVVIKDNQFLLVRKVGKDIWTNLGGKPETGETEEQALIREIKEEMGCTGVVKLKLGDFEAKAVFDDAIVRLSTYLVDLEGTIEFNDPELEEYRFFSETELMNVKIPDSVKNHMIPFCIKNNFLDWPNFK